MKHLFKEPISTIFATKLVNILPLMKSHYQGVYKVFSNPITLASKITKSFLLWFDKIKHTKKSLGLLYTSERKKKTDTCTALCASHSPCGQRSLYSTDLYTATRSRTFLKRVIVAPRTTVPVSSTYNSSRKELFFFIYIQHEISRHVSTRQHQNATCMTLH